MNAAISAGIDWRSAPCGIALDAGINVATRPVYTDAPGRRTAARRDGSANLGGDTMMRRSLIQFVVAAVPAALADTAKAGGKERVVVQVSDDHPKTWN
jgi:hypothetical protein